MPAQQTSDPADAASTGIVLSGGGARGAYEAGVVKGLMEVLRPKRRPFDVLCGTSVGALNATYLAAHADLPDMGAGGLIDEWLGLDVKTHLKLDLRGLLGWKRDWAKQEPDALPRLVGRSLLNASALERVVREAVPWERLAAHVSSGLVRSVVISALHIASGRTTLFASLSPGTRYSASKDYRRIMRFGPITPDHVLASAAIPLVFPARRVEHAYYCDGGLRFNTPVAPAIRSGAERLVVVSLLSADMPVGNSLPPSAAVESYDSPIFLVGKVLNALLLDPLRHDLQVLERFNRLIDVLEKTLPPEELAHVQSVIRQSRGLPYRRIDTLVFRPSQDVGHLARERSRHLQASRFSSWLIARTATLGTLWESDLLSFILFDSDFARDLIELGRTDVHARADEVHEFFARS